MFLASINEYVLHTEGVHGCPLGYSAITIESECDAYTRQSSYAKSNEWEGGQGAICYYCGGCSTVGISFNARHANLARWVCRLNGIAFIIFKNVILTLFFHSNSVLVFFLGYPDVLQKLCNVIPLYCVNPQYILRKYMVLLNHAKKKVVFMSFES